MLTGTLSNVWLALWAQSRSGGVILPGYKAVVEEPVDHEALSVYRYPEEKSSQRWFRSPIFVFRGSIVFQRSRCPVDPTTWLGLHVRCSSELSAAAHLAPNPTVNFHNDRKFG
ncbi:hypothetical protein MRB53_039175 [Persea americana]|nr:hypothetical protein MRB53_039175 [Persea americana]